MKKLLMLTWLMSLIFASASDADQSQEDLKTVQDLRSLQAWCDEMADGQVRTEVFGLLFVKNGSRCQFTNGELDDQMRKYFNDNQLTWAGVEGEHGLWVEDSSND